MPITWFDFLLFVFDLRWAKGREPASKSAPVLPSRLSGAVPPTTSSTTTDVPQPPPTDGALFARPSVTAGGTEGGTGGTSGPSLEEALLVVKWGGVLTHAGRKQAEDLGACMLS